jgi:hypothetical protein
LGVYINSISGLKMKKFFLVFVLLYIYHPVFSAVLYFDDFSNPATLANYEDTYLLGSTGASIAITGGELVISSPSSTLAGRVILVKDSIVSRSITDYTVECDAMIDSFSSYGDFGLAFRGNIVQSPRDADYYSFLINGNPEHSVPHWQAVRFYDISGYQYLAGVSFGTGAASPAYTPGTWVHIKVVCAGQDIKCYVGAGAFETLVFSFTNAAFPSGGAGFHADFLRNGNTVHYKNFMISADVTPTLTPVISTPTPADTGTTTPEVSPTITGTFTITTTATLTYTDTLTRTLTLTPTITQTETDTATAIDTDTYTCSPTETKTHTITPTSTVTLAGTKTATITETGTITPTLAVTATRTVTFDATRTFTFTETSTLTQTITASFTPPITHTATPTTTTGATTTETPSPAPYPTGDIYIFPNPFNPGTSVSGKLKIINLPLNSKIYIYTLSGELVNFYLAQAPVFLWDAANIYGQKVSAGIYYCVIYRSTGVLLSSGKIFVINR